MYIYRFSKYFAILWAISSFVYSTLQLLNFAVSQGAISKSTFPFLSSLYVYAIISLSIMFISSIIVFLGYFKYAKTINQQLLKYISLVMIIVYLLWALTIISIWASKSLSFLSQRQASVLLSIAFLIFSLVILSKKSNHRGTILIISILYLLECILIFTSKYTIVQLTDFVIAIHICEAIFFNDLKSERRFQ